MKVKSYEELIAWQKTVLLTKMVYGVVLKRRHYFGGCWVKHGTYPTRILRLFRTSRARYADNMVMDEHLVVKGKTVEFDNDFVDESLISFEDWKEKHCGYAKREAQQAMESLKSGVWTDPRKARYYKLPPYFRAPAYFCVRYFLKLGFLDGAARSRKLDYPLATLGPQNKFFGGYGWRWHLWQGLWYRWLVDREITNCVVRKG